VIDSEPGEYKGHDYDYYQKKFQGATQQRGFGIFLTITGAAANITSVVLASDGNDSNDNTGVGLNIYGILAFNTGLPLWISGGIKRGKNRRAMKRTQSNTIPSKSFTLGSTNYGLGFTYNF
jgi:hypothetical protein